MKVKDTIKSLIYRSIYKKAETKIPKIENKSDNKILKS